MMADTMTTKGRKVYRDEQTGENYSERSITFETEDGWITIPTVDADGNQLTQSELEEFVSENGPVDPVTGAELPLFETVEDAEEYARNRSDNLMPNGAEEQMGMYHGGMPCGCDGECDGSCGDYAIGMDPVSGNPVPPGSHEINVRDDIPAVLSEGEYVVPADVVRYHGLKTFMTLRDEAKLGLMAMHMEGQIKTLEEEDAYYEDEEELDSEELETESDVPATEDETEEGEGELLEEGYETPEGNMVATPEPQIEEDGMLTYRPSVSFAILKS